MSSAQDSPEASQANPKLDVQTNARNFFGAAYDIISAYLFSGTTDCELISLRARIMLLEPRLPMFHRAAFRLLLSHIVAGGNSKYVESATELYNRTFAKHAAVQRTSQKEGWSKEKRLQFQATVVFKRNQLYQVIDQEDSGTTVWNWEEDSSEQNVNKAAEKSEALVVIELLGAMFKELDKHETQMVERWASMETEENTEKNREENYGGGYWNGRY